MEPLVLAAVSDASQSPGTPALLALLIGIPLLVVALVSAIVLGPKWSRAGRWRPGQPWHNEPMWFGDGSPVDLGAVLAREEEANAVGRAAIAAGAGDSPSAGPAAEAATDGGPRPVAVEAAGDWATQNRGGARGRW